MTNFKTICNDLIEVVLDKKISRQKLTGVYHTDFERFGAMPVQSTDYPIIKDILKVLSLNGTEKILDVGCGLGRFLGYLSIKGHKGNLLGVEIDKTYADFCSFIFKDKKQIKIIHGNALEVSLPQDYIAYLYNPFSEKMLDRFLDQNNFPLLIYSNDVYRKVFKRHNNYKLFLRIKSKLNDGTLVPVSFYKSISNTTGQ
ncbi:MAG: rRNA adenine N-6-methyltransferase family protein [Sphaerochaetaceae bacterium]